MAKNPKWWKDSEADPEDDAEEAAPRSRTHEFDPALLDGEPVPGTLNHERLDAVIAHRNLDTTNLAPEATRADKVKFINEASVL